MFKVAKTNNIYPNLSATPMNDQQLRLNRMNEIKDYLGAEIKERESTSKRLSKYIASFDSFDKSLIDLPVTNGSVSITSFETVIGASVGTVSESFSLAFSISIGIIKKTVKNNKK